MADGVIIYELAAELNRVTAERDKWRDAAQATSWHRLVDIARCEASRRHAEIERMRNLAAALEAELARVDRPLAHKIRNEIIASSAPYWALDGGRSDYTADEVRAEVNPVLTAIIHACSDVIGDGFYP